RPNPSPVALVVRPPAQLCRDTAAGRPASPGERPASSSPAPHPTDWRSDMRCARTVMVLCLALVLPSCATIAGGGSNQAVTVQSTPAPASFTIQSSSGIQMAQGTTPTTVRLPRKNEYQIQITMPGYHPQTAVLTKGINGWI